MNRSDTQTTTTTRVMIAVLIVVATVSVLWPSTDIYFLRDDFEWLASCSDGWQHPQQLLARINQYFRPLIKLSYLVNLSLFGTKFMGFALTTIVIHIANVVLLYLLLLRLIPNPWLCGGASLLFGISPLHSEVTLWAAGRPDSVLLLFILLALLAVSRSPHGSGFRDHLVLGLCAVGALAAKETWVIMPFLVLTFLLVVEGVPAVTAIRRTVSLWIVSGLYAVIFVAVPYFTGSTNLLEAGAGGAVGIGQGLMKIGYLFYHYLGRGERFDGRPLELVVMVVALVVLTIVLIRNRRRVSLWGLLWIVIAIAPSLPIAKAPSRYNYIPLVGFWIVVAGVVHWSSLSLNRSRATRLWLCRIAAPLLFVYIATMQAILLRHEIGDYRMYGSHHRKLVDEFNRIRPTIPVDEPILFVDTCREHPLSTLDQEFKGFPKVIFPRNEGLRYLIPFRELASFCGHDAGLEMSDLGASAYEDHADRIEHVVAFTCDGFRSRPAATEIEAVSAYLSRHGELPANVGVEIYR